MTPDPCLDYLPLIVRAADDSLEPDRRRELEAHVRTCGACRDALAGQQVVHLAMAERPVARASAGFVDGVMSEVARNTWLDLLDFRALTWRVAPLAAAAAIAAYLVLGVQTPAPAAATDMTADEVPVAAALMSETVGSNDLVSLMLFANPDDSLTTALEETGR